MPTPRPTLDTPKAAPTRAILTVLNRITPTTTRATTTARLTRVRFVLIALRHQRVPVAVKITTNRPVRDPRAAMTPGGITLISADRPKAVVRFTDIFVQSILIRIVDIQSIEFQAGGFFALPAFRGIELQNGIRIYLQISSSS